VRGAVARLAEDAFGELDEAQQAVAEAVLMRLVDAGEGDAVERRRVALDELQSARDEDIARVVALLTDRRLLTVDAGSIEIAHEALLREWPRLRGWIERNREGLRIQRTLREAAREWDRVKRDDGALLRGPRLDEAVEWRDTRSPPLTELERTFLTASETARRRDRVTRRRRMALAFGSLGVALLAISVVAAYSIVDGKRTASRELANRSAAVLAGDPALALGIGLEALDRYGTDEARNAVRQATLADRAVAVTHAHRSAVYRAALSPDGAQLATAGDDGTVRIVSLGDAGVISTIKSAAAPLTDVAMSPDGKHVASASVAGGVAVSDLDGGARHAVLKLAGDPFYARSVEYDAQGRQLLVAVHGDDSIRVAGVGDGRSRTLARHTGVRVARWQPDGRGVISAGEDGDARLWGLDGRLKATLHHGSDIYDARFSPDGRFVATAGADGAVRIWSARSGRLLHKLALDLQAMYSVRFSPDGRRVVAGGADGVVRVIGIGGGPLLAELKGHRDRVYDAGFLGGDDAVYSVGADGTVRTWSLPKIAAMPADPRDPPTAPSLSPDGKLVVSGYTSGRVRLWNPRTGAVTAIPGHKAYSVATYSADGAYILSLSNDRTARLYDVKRRTSSRIPVSDSDKNAMAIDPAGRRIAFAGLAGLGEGTVIQGRDGRGRVHLPVHGQVVWLTFSPDGRHLLSASEDGTARIWNAATGAPERVLKGGEGAMLQAQYSPDGKRVATAGADGSVRIWNVAGGDPLVFYGHEGPVTSVGFSHDGKRIVSGGKDGTVRVWDTADGSMRVVLSRYDAAVTAVAFGRQNQVLSATDDAIVLSTCDVCGPFADVLALARTRPEVKLSAVERARLGLG
jgi:WD40 repeat protein